MQTTISKGRGQRDTRNTLEAICGYFDPIPLEKMREVRLMDRREIKYTVHRALLPVILSRIVDDYRILEINGETLMPYKSVYFDTEDYKLYTLHQNGKLNRYKVRNRTYELTGTEYLEIKFKSNKKRTIKRRIEVGGKDRARKERDFVRANLPSAFLDLEEKLIVRYQRLMLVDQGKTERVTIDLNLTCSDRSGENRYDELAVVEIKREGDLKNSPIAGVLSELNIRNISFSKYCLGISDLCGDVKKNMMKVKKRNVRRTLEHQSHLSLVI